MKLKIGDLELEAESQEDFSFMVAQLPAIRSVVPTASTNSNGNEERPRIKRTRDEIDRGLSIDDAIAERKLKAGSDSGATFDGGELNLDEVDPNDVE